MNTKKTYGQLIYDPLKDEFVITRAEPHVCIRLKHIFPKIPVSQPAPFHFKNADEICADLHWFLQRYPLEVEESVLNGIITGKGLFEKNVNDVETILLPDYHPAKIELKDGEQARDYQLKGNEVHMKVGRLLLGDDFGLGKTLTAILSFLQPGTLPAVVVVQTHMPQQWKTEQIERFTNLRVHIIKGTRPYNLPEADVYILKYSCLAGWVDLYSKYFFKSAVFDEMQELRREGSQKYNAARVLSENVTKALGLTATPIYNYGDEIFNILDLIKPGCLGVKDDFFRAWAPSYRHVKDPQALGTYLREKLLFLRRTRAEVGRELPPTNTIIHTVEYDEVEVEKSENIMRQLAMKVMSGSFVERGEAARELDIKARYITGVSKASGVAQLVRILLENGEPVVLSGWHRDVYDIWLSELADFKPVMYTGSETGPQKELAKQAFINGETPLFIISLRSGAGLDGLQKVCKLIVHGELDWSPKVHDQLNARVRRDDGDREMDQVTAIYCTSDYGSDPVMMNILGLKASQSHGIVDPLLAPAAQYTDESRIKLLAQKYLEKKKVQQNLFGFN